MKRFNTLLLLITIVTLFGCQSKAVEDYGDGWQLEQQVTKQVDNLHFIFPVEGHAFDNRETFVAKSSQSIEENCALIGLSDYSNPIKMRFLNSRKEMKQQVGSPATGWTNMWTQEIHVVANDSEDRIVKTPIKHEIMHMITMTLWGYPHDNLIWLNEGMATYAGDDCNEIKSGEIYHYFLTEEMLLPIDSLSNSFYNQDDMIAYHQSAYIVEYLMKKYGVQKIEEFWKKGFASFEEVYGVPFSEMVENINKAVIEKYENSPVIDWDEYKKECG